MSMADFFQTVINSISKRNKQTEDNSHIMAYSHHLTA